jgi:hypothetical protein
MSRAVCFSEPAMRSPFRDLGRGAIACGVSLVVIACGSLDIDALGAGSADAASDAQADAVAEPGREGGDGGVGATAKGDGGWQTPPVEEDAPWSPGGWKELASGTTNDLEAVWGATSRSVWAGGKNGTLLHFDGITWSPATSTIASGSTVRALAGSASDDVYLLEQRGAPNGTMFLHHYDGTSWAEVSTFGGVNNIGCLDVPARRVAYVYGAPKLASTVSAENALRLYRVDGRTPAAVTLIGTSPYVATDAAACDVHAFAPDDIWVTGAPVSRWNGASFVSLPGAPPASEMLSVVSRTLAFTRSHVWNGTSWDQKWIGMQGSLTRVSGRTDALAFGAVYTVRGVVLRYAGGSWIEEPLPEGLAATRSVYMAPNGRTFAVGRVGMVWSGP